MTAAEHGNTPAAWTTVSMILAGFIVGAVAVVMQNWPLFWIGGPGLVVLAVVVGKIMQMMGMGRAANGEPVVAAASSPEYDG